MKSIRVFFFIYLFCVFVTVNTSQDSTFVIKGNGYHYENSSRFEFFTLCNFDYVCFIAAGAILLPIFGGIKASLVISCCLSTGILINALIPLRIALNNSHPRNYQQTFSLFTILNDIVTSSADLEIDQQTLIVECIGAIFCCLMQISLSLLILCEADNFQTWRKAWLVLQVPTSFFTFYTIFSNQIWLTYSVEYDTFKKSVFVSLVFSYFTLPSLILLERTEKRTFVYYSSPEFRV